MKIGRKEKAKKNCVITIRNGVVRDDSPSGQESEWKMCNSNLKIGLDYIYDQLFQFENGEVGIWCLI